MLAIGLQLTFYGMGLVFLLLAFLWGGMTLLLRLDRGSAREEPAPESAEGTATALSPELVAAIIVAVQVHRAVRRKQAAPAMRSHWPGTLPSRWVVAGRTRQTQSWHPRRG